MKWVTDQEVTVETSVKKPAKPKPKTSLLIGLPLVALASGVVAYAVKKYVKSK